MIETNLGSHLAQNEFKCFERMEAIERTEHGSALEHSVHLKREMEEIVVEMALHMFLHLESQQTVNLCNEERQSK